MSPFVAEDRPSYVRFEVRSVEDRNATIAAGHYVGKDVTYAIITPTGNKDEIERPVDEWFDKLRQDVANGRLPPQWLQAYQGAYDAWKSGQEMPLDGTPLATWPPVTPSVLKTLRDLRVLTVEDLAVANDDTIYAIGMGGRALKQQAIDWLSAAKDVGKVAAQLSALQADVNNLKVQLESAENRNKELEQELAAATKPAGAAPRPKSFAVANA